MKTKIWIEKLKSIPRSATIEANVMAKSCIIIEMETLQFEWNWKWKIAKKAVKIRWVGLVCSKCHLRTCCDGSEYKRVSVLDFAPPWVTQIALELVFWWPWKKYNTKMRTTVKYRITRDEKEILFSAIRGSHLICFLDSSGASMF